jgi:hypothetical protein
MVYDARHRYGKTSVVDPDVFGLLDRIRLSEVPYRILLSSRKHIEKNLNSRCFVTFFMTFLT